MSAFAPAVEDGLLAEPKPFNRVFPMRQKVESRERGVFREFIDLGEERVFPSDALGFGEDTTSPNSQKLEQIRKKIESFSQLEENWDGDGALRITNEVCEKAKDILARNIAPFIYFSDLIQKNKFPEPSACADGSIDLYWDARGFRFLINISDETTFYGEKFGEMEMRGTLLNPVCRPLKDFLLRE